MPRRDDDSPEPPPERTGEEALASLPPEQQQVAALVRLSAVLAEIAPLVREAVQAQRDAAAARAAAWSVGAELCRSAYVQIAVAIGVGSLLVGLSAWAFGLDPSLVPDLVRAWRCETTATP